MDISISIPLNNEMYANHVIWVARLPKIRCFRSLDRCLIAKDAKLFSESLVTNHDDIA